MKLRRGLVLPLLMLAACVNAPEEETGIRILSVREIQALLPGQGQASFPGVADKYVMVDPNADCRRTLGVSQCTLYIDPPSREVAHNAVPPGDAQIRAGNGGDGRISGSAAIPLGAQLRADGSLIPLSIEGAPLPVAAISPVGAAPLINNRPISVTPALDAPFGAVPTPPAKPAPSPLPSAKPKKTSATGAHKGTKAAVSGTAGGRPPADPKELPTTVIPSPGSPDAAPVQPATASPAQKGPIGGKPFPAVPPGPASTPISGGAPTKLSPVLTP